jgi:hypothetical protein
MSDLTGVRSTLVGPLWGPDSEVDESARREPGLVPRGATGESAAMSLAGRALIKNSSHFALTNMALPFSSLLHNRANDRPNSLTTIREREEFNA